MPADRVQTKQTRVITAGGSNTPQTSVRAAPYTPGRTLIMLQNVGANPGLVHFKETVQGDLSDYTVLAGAYLPVFDQADTCPIEAINLGSALITTWVLLEQVSPLKADQNK